ncbi:MAG TPA: superoxide dismutase family protein [Pirellulales bacterium]|jgi:Cu-Zn family superoxide dismutase|nr:superoxide dismutase family protein [Pirellulales bacterium]
MNKNILLRGMVACLLLAVAAGAEKPRKHHHENEMAPAKEAVCVLVPMKESGVTGTLLLKQAGDTLRVTGQIAGLKPGEHGFHVHTYGDLRSDDGSSAGGHYAPEGHEHGGPDSPDHHAGDLGNITAGDDGVANVDVKSKDLRLHFIIGRSIVVHANPDDLKSQPAGNSGPRIAVGVIGVADTEAESSKK